MNASTPPRTGKKFLWLRPYLIVICVIVLLIGLLVLVGTQVTVEQRVVSASVRGVMATAADEKILLPFTANLPSVDQVEIESIESNPGGIPTKVLATLSLKGERATEFGNLWKSQQYAFGLVGMCHQPGYRIRFYSQGSLLVETTVCFDCENILFRKPWSSQFYGASFAAKTSNGQKLRSYLADLFPRHDPDASK